MGKTNTIKQTIKRSLDGDKLFKKDEKSTLSIVEIKRKMKNNEHKKINNENHWTTCP